MISKNNQNCNKNHNNIQLQISSTNYIYPVIKNRSGAPLGYRIVPAAMVKDVVVVGGEIGFVYG